MAFSKKEMIKWLDMLAKVSVKTRDNFACQIQMRSPKCNHIKCRNCLGTMEPLSYDCQWCHIKSGRRYHSRWILFNALCGCAHCHRWAHDNPTDFGAWFADRYPERHVFLSMPLVTRTWREFDFKQVEQKLLKQAIDFNVDILHLQKQYRRRYELRTANLRCRK